MRSAEKIRILERWLGWDREPWSRAEEHGAHLEDAKAHGPLLKFVDEL